MLPALVSVFDSEVTSLAPVGAVRIGLCFLPESQTFLRFSNEEFSDFPLRNQKLGVPIRNGYSQFGYVSSSATGGLFRPSASGAELCKNLSVFTTQFTQSLTGKRSLTYSIAPFKVQLFVIGFFVRLPRRSNPGTACHQTATPLASRVKRSRISKTTSHGRDLACFHTERCRTRFVGNRSIAKKKHSLLHRHGLTDISVSKVCPHRPFSL